MAYPYALDAPERPQKTTTKSRPWLHHPAEKERKTRSLMACAETVETKGITKTSVLNLRRMPRTTHQRRAAQPMLLLKINLKTNQPFLLNVGIVVSVMVQIGLPRLMRVMWAVSRSPRSYLRLKWMSTTHHSVLTQTRKNLTWKRKLSMSMTT